MNIRLEPQPPPQPTGAADIWPLVIADMRARNEQGIAKYGVPLTANNGRDPMVDAYQESLDQCAYIRQAIEERALLMRKAAAFDWLADQDVAVLGVDSIGEAASLLEAVEGVMNK